MKILYDWLKEFVAVPFAPGELRERLSLAGIAVEGLDETPAGPLLDLDLTINRPDCLGHYGVAREVAALTRKQLPPVSANLAEAGESAGSIARVEIESPDLCGRFTARVLRGVRVQPSPDWLRRRLEALGQASINNLVDATNYVMLELGHPMHAYDLDLLAERRIIVRRSRPGDRATRARGARRRRASPVDLPRGHGEDTIGMSFSWVRRTIPRAPSEGWERQSNDKLDHRKETRQGWLSRQ